VVRALGQKRAAGQGLLEGLLTSELDDVDVRGSLTRVVVETHDRDELIGALQAIGWLAPSGGFPATTALQLRVHALIGHPEEAIQVLARQALVALS
jgi:hypothetical protein